MLTLVNITFDLLISQSNGNTFIFDNGFCPLYLLKKIILEGFQVRNYNPIFEYSVNSFSAIEGNGWGASRRTIEDLQSGDGVYGEGEGRGWAIGEGFERGYGEGEGYGGEEESERSSIPQTYYLI